jgi:hypothetical protein
MENSRAKTKRMYNKASQKDFADNPTHSGPPTRSTPLAPWAPSVPKTTFLLWKLYLPSTCIAAMIAMGWDRTT